MAIGLVLASIGAWAMRGLKFAMSVKGAARLTLLAISLGAVTDSLKSAIEVGNAREVNRLLRSRDKFDKELVEIAMRASKKTGPIPKGVLVDMEQILSLTSKAVDL